MKHLAAARHPGARADANARGDLVFEFKGKPAAVVTRLRGSSELSPTPAHCAAVGTTLANMHLAGRDFPLSQPNLRGLSWWNETVPVVLPSCQPDAGRVAAKRTGLPKPRRRLIGLCRPAPWTDTRRPVSGQRDV